MGLRIADVWLFRPHTGWLGPSPPHGTRVIAKNTYESCSVGIDSRSVFVIGPDTDTRLYESAQTLGQPITVQTFIAGDEVCVAALSCPRPLTLPPMRQALARAPDDPEVILTYADNFRADSITYNVFEPSSSVNNELTRLTLNIIDMLQVGSPTRLDYRIDSFGVPWLTDIATSPGWGHASAMYSAARLTGIGYADFLRAIVASSLDVRGLLPT
ncbi:hypothetical protein [Candidatus Poriferisodalis sp.]|uniref:hypothetical protein n=1 Tax=Candidatus Poriferisodalis sp. TaxID=3101277 RepID=UPI003B01762F